MQANNPRSLGTLHRKLTYNLLLIMATLWHAEGLINIPVSQNSYLK